MDCPCRSIAAYRLAMFLLAGGGASAQERTLETPRIEAPGQPTEQDRIESLEHFSKQAPPLQERVPIPAPPEGECQEIRGLEVSAEVPPESGVLTKWKAMVEGKCVGVQTLNALWAAIQRHYRDAGYLPNGIAIENPEGDPALMRLRIKLLKCERVFFEGQDVTGHWGTFPGRSGLPVRIAEIDQALENLQKTGYPDAQVELELVPGLESAMIRFAKGKARSKHFTVGADDQGTEAFGRGRWNASASAWDILKRAERFSFSLTRPTDEKERTRNTALQAQGEIPLGFHTFNLSLLRSDYEIPFTLQDGGLGSYAGHALTTSLGWSWVAHRNPRQVDRLLLGMDWRTPEQELRVPEGSVRIDGSSRKLTTFSWGVSSEHLFRESGAAVSLSVNNRYGLTSGGAYRDPGDLGREEAHSQYRSHSLDLLATKVLPIQRRNFEALFFGRFFYSPVGLYPIERFALLSASTVDGFQAQSADVDRGWLGRAQLRTRFVPGAGVSLLPSISYVRAGGKSLVDGRAYRVSSWTLEAVIRNSHVEATAHLNVPIRGKEGEPKPHPRIAFSVKAMF